MAEDIKSTSQCSRNHPRPELKQLATQASHPFGVLIPTEESVKSVNIFLGKSSTTFGRSPSCDFVHPDHKQKRVPKQALNISIQGLKTDPDTAYTIISTSTTRYIEVNDVRLSRGENCWLYGELQTGDIITVFKSCSSAKCLRFLCIFLAGKSKAKRSESKPFKIRKEFDNFRRWKERRETKEG